MLFFPFTSQKSLFFPKACCSSPGSPQLSSHWLAQPHTSALRALSELMGGCLGCVTSPMFPHVVHPLPSPSLPWYKGLVPGQPPAVDEKQWLSVSWNLPGVVEGCQPKPARFISPKPKSQAQTQPCSLLASSFFTSKGCIPFACCTPA